MLNYQRVTAPVPPSRRSPRCQPRNLRQQLSISASRATQQLPDALLPSLFEGHLRCHCENTENMWNIWENQRTHGGTVRNMMETYGKYWKVIGRSLRFGVALEAWFPPQLRHVPGHPVLHRKWKRGQKKEGNSEQWCNLQIVNCPYNLSNALMMFFEDIFMMTYM